MRVETAPASVSFVGETADEEFEYSMPLAPLVAVGKWTEACYQEAPSALSGNAGMESLGAHEMGKRERSLYLLREHFPDNPNIGNALTGRANGAINDLQQRQYNFERLLRMEEKAHDAQSSRTSTRHKVGLLEEAVRSLQDEAYPDDREVAAALTNLAEACGQAGLPERQKDVLFHALLIKERTYGPEHSSIADTLTALGDALQMLGDLKAMQEVLHRALRIREQALGPFSPKLTATLMNLGKSYRRVGRSDIARQYFERALLLKEKEYGPDDPELALVNGYLSLVHGDLGNEGPRDSFMAQALCIFERRMA